MANPKFTKAGTPEVELSQAPDLATSESIRPRQTIQRAYDGGHNVLVRGIEDNVFNLIFSELPSTDADALRVFFESTVVDFSRHAFTYTDENSVARQVRYLQGNLPGIPVGPTVRRLSLTLILDRKVLD